MAFFEGKKRYEGMSVFEYLNSDEHFIISFKQA
eukprot:CAMPEP_0116874092 /NCGR_PEP_ID=MMETSP0463-20121206/5489_1 /TAXON_ID=181622 /ORGANISM="Strombidinopsis sp, Strain SopsisLIS2011" /LENGTH=32 /DNA_ID= /DNA_START= /DNA_END= /DNA_ORIENTATION=